MAQISEVFNKATKQSSEKIFLSGEGQKTGRHVCLLSAADFKSLDSSGGLCAARFKPDVITTGIDFCSVKPGDVLEIGKAIIEISQVGKDCFSECKIFQGGERCGLAYGVAFANVVSPGDVTVGDEIIGE